LDQFTPFQPIPGPKQGPFSTLEPLRSKNIEKIRYLRFRFKKLHYNLSANVATPVKRTIMNKAELVDAIAAQASVTKKEADAVLSAMIDVVMETVAKQDKVTLVGFGTFEARDRQAREGRNPSTGEPIKIPATTVPAFSAGKGFKDMVATAKPAKGAAKKK
jgi:DNA-binding protein HU-beta